MLVIAGLVGYLIVRAGRRDYRNRGAERSARYERDRALWGKHARW